MSHDHHHARAFGIGIALNSAFVGLELFFGYAGHSLALIADAGHNFSDVLALGAAWGAVILSRKIPSRRYTYGFRSSSILAGLFNAVLLLVVTGGIIWEAIARLGNPEAVSAKTVVSVAAIGFFINLFSAWLLHEGHEHDLNLRAAFFHMASDAAVSLGVALSGIVVLYTGYVRLDPMVSLAISLAIIYGTWDLLKDSVGLALHAVPGSIAPEEVRAYLAALPGVTEVHDMHIWGMSTTESALTVHLVMPNGHAGDAFMSGISKELNARFHIDHATIQVEIGDTDHPCTLAPEHLV